MKCVEVYKELYHQEPFDVAFCPYRISPLGAHIDHQYGKINGLAIDKGIHMAYHPKQNGVVELQSLNFPKRAQFFVSAVPDEKQGDWADHLRGAAKMLGEKYRLKVGLSGIIEGSLPIGGLSSSASVIICFLSALCKVNGIHLEPMEMILTAKAAENQYVGVSCGKLDQSCEVLSKKNHLLYLDTKDDSYELIPTSEKMKPYKVAIFFSGLERSLKNSKYNLRQDECKAAAYALMGYAGMDYDTFANTRLRDVPYARSLLEGEKVYPCYYPTNRSLKALVKNTKIAWDVLHKEKPDLIVSCGAAVAVPFFYIGKMMGAKVVYIEVFDRIDKPTMTGKMVYPIADKFVVQWDEQKKVYPKAVNLGSIF